MVFSLGSWGSLSCSDKKKSGIPKAIAVKKVTTSRCYHVVVDLNGILVLRGVYRRGQERTVTLRLGCRSFLEWIRKREMLSLWNSVNDKNIEAVLKVVLDGVSFTRNDIIVLTQSACSQSTYKDPKNPKKPIFLKKLDVYANIVKL
jgi:hypothetical protein